MLNEMDKDHADNCKEQRRCDASDDIDELAETKRNGTACENSNNRRADIDG